jgi:hypothetical protein
MHSTLTPTIDSGQRRHNTIYDKCDLSTKGNGMVQSMRQVPISYRTQNLKEVQGLIKLTLRSFTIDVTWPKASIDVTCVGPYMATLLNPYFSLGFDVFPISIIMWVSQACFMKHSWSKMVDIKLENMYVWLEFLYKIPSSFMPTFSKQKT